MTLYRQIQQFFDPLYSKERRHVSWGKLTVAIEKFQLMIQAQEKELLDSLYQIISKKLDYLQSFIEYKQSVFKVKNKEEVLTMNPKRVGKFLQSGYEEIVTIFKYLKTNPAVLSSLLTHLPLNSQKFFPDLALNLVGLYNSSCFLHQQMYETSELSLFFDAIFKDWNYTQNFDVKSIHTEIILSIFKLPQSKIFIQTLFKKFNKYVLEDLIQPDKSIDFNRNKIRQQILAQKSQKQKKQKSQSKPSFLKRLFGKGKKDQKKQSVMESMMASQQDDKISRIQQQRIGRLDMYMRRTIQIIFQQQIPSICKFITLKFVKMLRQKGKVKEQTPFNQIGNFLIKRWICNQIKQKIKQIHGSKHPEIIDMISFVQNIFLDRFDKIVFDQKISFNSLRQEIIDEIRLYYKSIIQDLQTLPKIQLLDELSLFQRNIMFVSFRDIVLLVNLIKAGQQKNDLPEELLKINLKFTQDTIYEPNNKISFDKKLYFNYNIYFCIPLQSEEEYVSKSYVGEKTPLNSIPDIGEILLKSDSTLSSEDTKTMSNGLNYLRGVESKLVIKAFQNFQNNNFSLPSGISQLQNILTLNEKSNEIINKKSKFLYFKSIILEQYNHHISLTEKYITRVKAQYIYQKYVLDVIENMNIQVYVSVDNQKMRIEEKLPQQFKRLDITLVLVSKKIQSKEENVMNEILENSMKKFQTVPRLIQAIAKLDFTKKAFIRWQRAEEFNECFKRLLSILHKVLDKNYKQEEAMIDLPSQKKMFNETVSKMLVHKVEKYHTSQKEEKTSDYKFLEQIKQIDVVSFKEEELQDVPIEDFAFEQAIQKFKSIDTKESPQAKLAEFDLLIREIFKIISLSLPKEKITADVITPIVQYIVLKSQAKYTVKSICQIRCLCIQESNYLLTLWRSALRYLKEYSKKKQDTTMSGVSINSSGQEFLD